MKQKGESERKKGKSGEKLATFGHRKKRSALFNLVFLASVKKLFAAQHQHKPEKMTSCPEG